MCDYKNCSCFIEADEFSENRKLVFDIFEGKYVTQRKLEFKMEKFGRAFANLLKFEGGYTSDPNETFCGIDRKFHAEWNGWEWVDKEKLAGRTPKFCIEIQPFVATFYLVNFWTPLRCDEIQDEKIASYLFDFAVNSGHSDAIRAIQKVVATTVDGVIGQKTLAAINTRKPDLTEFRVQRVLHYLTCILKKPTNIRFALGWIRRALA